MNVLHAYTHYNNTPYRTTNNSLWSTHRSIHIERHCILLMHNQQRQTHQCVMTQQHWARIQQRAQLAQQCLLIIHQYVLHRQQHGLLRTTVITNHNTNLKNNNEMCTYNTSLVTVSNIMITTHTYNRTHFKSSITTNTATPNPHRYIRTTNTHTYILLTNQHVQLINK